MVSKIDQNILRLSQSIWIWRTA